MIRPRAVVQAALRYVRDNPDALVRAAVDATGLRFGVPLAALRWAVTQTKPSKKSPKDIELGAAPPGLRVAATVDAMGTPLRASAVVRIDEVTITPGSLRVGLRLSSVRLTLVGESDAPIATLIKSGALDVSKPGNLLKFIPKRPPAIVEAEGDRIVLDLMRVPKLAANRRLKRALAILTPLLGVKRIETEGDHLVLALRATPAGLREAFVALRQD